MAFKDFIADKRVSEEPVFLSTQIFAAVTHKHTHTDIHTGSYWV